MAKRKLSPRVKANLQKIRPAFGGITRAGASLAAREAARTASSLQKTAAIRGLRGTALQSINKAVTAAKRTARRLKNR